MNKNRSTRREFLKIATAAAASAPFILPSRIWSAQTKPNDRITIGFIGVGKQGMGLLSGFLGSKEVQVVAVCDVDTTRRENAKKVVDAHYAKQSGGYSRSCGAYNDFRVLIAGDDIDAVVIATPDHWHALIAIAAADAGKDIYCEKPLCQSIHEARAMVNAVQRNGCVFQTGSMQRSSREFRVACELVRNGVIGQIQTVQVGVSGPPTPCDLPEEKAEPGLDWNLWLGPAPMRPYNSVLSPRGVHNHYPAWRSYSEYGGGGVTDWGAHHFDIAQWGLGMDDSGPVEIIPPVEYANAQQGVKFIYENGVVMFHVIENGVTFTGTDGKIFVNRGKFALELNGVSKAKSLSKEDKPSLSEQLDAAEKEFLTNAAIKLYVSTDHRADFISSVRNRNQPNSGVEIGARSVSVCHLANLAYNHGQAMKWDPAKEQFIDGTGNPKWLDVPYRGLWKLT